MIEIVAVVLVVAVFAAAVAVARGTRSRTSMLRALDQPSSAPATGVDPSAPLVRFLRRHRGARVTLSGLSIVLGLVAAGMLAYPFYTNLYQSRLQDRLDRQLVSPALQQAYKSRSL